MTSINDAPVLDLNGGDAGVDTSVTFTEDGPAVVLAPGLTLSDADPGQLMHAASVQLTIDPPSGTVVPDLPDELLTGDVAGACSFATTLFDFNTTTGTLLIIGDATVAEYRACLRTITYEDTLDAMDVTVRNAEFTVFDATGEPSNRPDATITLVPVNDAPVATDGTEETAEDDPAITVDLRDLVSDAETGDADLDYDVDAPAPAEGTIASGGPNGTFSFTPAPDFNGTVVITYTVTDRGDPDDCSPVDTDCDDVETSLEATVTITVTEVNDAPSADDDAATVAEDGSVDVDVQDGDSTGPSNESGQSLTTTRIVSGPDHGTATILGSGEVRYEPADDYNGPDSFVYEVCDDGTTDGDPDPLCATAEVTITVTEVNDAPSADDDAATVAEDGSVDVDVQDGDSTGPSNESGQSLTTTRIVSGPDHGTATILGSGEVRYEPADDYNGPDSFVYEVCDDGTTDGDPDPLCATAEVTITVTEVNDAPSADDDAATVAEDGSVDVDVQDGDSTGPSNESGQSLTTTRIVSGPDHGTATILGSGEVRYEPADDYNGPDSFVYEVCDDGTTDGDPDPLCATAEVTITVTEVNDAPSADDDAATVAEDGSVDVDVQDGDSTGPSNESGQSLTTTRIVSGPDHGTATILGSGEVRYEPADDYNGPDSFVYEVCDDGTTDGDPDPLCATAEVTITVTEVNDAPSADDDAATVAEDGSVDVDVQDGDSTGPSNESGQSLTTTRIVSGPDHGTATILGSGEVRYEPADDYNGPDSFVYEVCDDGTTDGDPDPLCATAEVTITVTEVNDAPSADDDAATVAEDGSVDVDVQDGDSTGPSNESGQSLTTTRIVSGPDHGTATILGSGEVRYEPADDYNGPDSFVYEVCDDGTTDGDPDPLCATAEVTIDRDPRERSAHCCRLRREHRRGHLGRGRPCRPRERRGE